MIRSVDGDFVVPAAHVLHENHDRPVRREDDGEPTIDGRQDVGFVEAVVAKVHDKSPEQQIAV